MLTNFSNICCWLREKGETTHELNLKLVTQLICGFWGSRWGVSDWSRINKLISGWSQAQSKSNQVANFKCKTGAQPSAINTSPHSYKLSNFPLGKIYELQPWCKLRPRTKSDSDKLPSPWGNRSTSTLLAPWQAVLAIQTHVWTSWASLHFGTHFAAAISWANWNSCARFRFPRQNGGEVRGRNLY